MSRKKKKRLGQIKEQAFNKGKDAEESSKEALEERINTELLHEIKPVENEKPEEGSQTDQDTENVVKEENTQEADTGHEDPEIKETEKEEPEIKETEIKEIIQNEPVQPEEVLEDNVREDSVSEEITEKEPVQEDHTEEHPGTDVPLEEETVQEEYYQEESAYAVTDDYENETEEEAEETKVKSSKQNNPSKYSVLFVPDNAENVKQFNIGIDFLIVLGVILVLIFVAGVAYVLHSAAQVEDQQAQILALTAQVNALTNANVMMEATIEELNSELREANATINTSNYMKEQTEQARAMDYIPSGLPLDGQVSVPSAYTDDTKYISFVTGSGTKIVATGAGVVTSIVDDATYGHVIQVDHDNGYVSVYYSTAEPMVNEGDSVIRGTPLFICGDEDSILYYQIMYENKYVDPGTIMKIDG
ncbi:MAG: peptidoglycan DD-metalloendopeptidase family protein [Lachnospiraceae bacterium]|nr:peptidoglycan DD-metalloendopeptidase family protein [Lachnospiraceae bacterium]